MALARFGLPGALFRRRRFPEFGKSALQSTAVFLGPSPPPNVARVLADFLPSSVLLLHYVALDGAGIQIREILRIKHAKHLIMMSPA